jgi:hypothetical protein
MSLNRRQQIDYTQRYQIRSGRVNFVDYVQKRQLIEEGRLVGLNLYPPDLDSSIIPIIQEGETNTTPEELERYLAEVALPNPVPSSGPVPDAPFNLIGTSGDGEVTISFTPGNDNGSPITNYEYMFPDASGATFEPFDPPTGAVSSLIFTGLENGRTYQIQIRAVNVNGPSSATSTFLITPVPGGTNLILFLDGANGGSAITWNDTSGKLNNCALTAAPTYSTSNGGYYIFDGSTQFGEVPDGFDNFTAGITIMAFVNFGTGNLWERLIDFGNGTQSNNILITRAGTTTNLAFELYNGVSQPISFSNSLINGIINNQWMFVVARLDGTNYRLGNQNGSNSGASSVLPTNIQRTNNYIGKSNWPDDSLFGGNMGIVAIYKSALTNQQITDFFDLFKNRYFTVPAPVITTITGANQSMIVNFTQAVSDITITNYKYSTDNGVTFAELDPPNTSSPIIITKISSDGVTNLTNGNSYDVIIRAVTAIGTNPISNMVSATPNATIVPFTTVGTTTWTAPADITSIQYVVVGGGGGSGATHDGGGAGGGGGGMVLTGTFSVTPGNAYSVIVGDGGAGGISYSSGSPGPGGIRETDGSPGNNSEFDTIVALGGGEGYRSRFNGTGDGGAAVTDPNTASIGGYGGSFNNGGGGGGGDSAAGSNGTLGGTRNGGPGGSGTTSNISGVSVTYGIGGNGGRAQANDPAEPGANNTGNGANGPGIGFANQRNGAKGGSGIVILKY